MKTLKNIICIASVILPSALSAQKSLNVLDLDNDTKIPYRSKTIQAVADVGKYAFHSQIGGVSFQSVARPAAHLSNAKVSLDYVDNRFTVKIGDKTFTPNLPDWILCPVVAFVSTPYEVAYSSAGDSVGKNEAQCRFHPAFVDKLAGLRLFQADLLNIPGVLWDLPVDENGDYILAQSESQANPTKDSVINHKLYDELVGSSRQFSSYCLTDYGVGITFDIEGNYLILSGHPRYYFTKTVVDETKVEEMRKSIEKYYDIIAENAKLFLGEKYTADINPRTNMRELRRVLRANSDQANFNPYPWDRLEKAFAALDSLNKIDEANYGIRFQPLTYLSEAFDKNWPMLKHYNPQVFNTVETICRWAALFRYVKMRHPDNWMVFVSKTAKRPINDAPAVKTPTSCEINYIRIFGDKIREQEIY
jgi:hypothetical protein